jgi:RNA polymerase sigma-70 factor (ECF subfamily)
MTGDPDTAEDIVQDVFTRFAQSVSRLGLTGSLRSYLITSTLNGVRNHRRTVQRRQTVGLDKAENVPATTRRPDQWAVLNERLERLSGAMACLPYEQREVISLRMETNMPFRQIAGVQQTSISTVNARYRYGIEKLRSLLNSEVTQ